MAIYLGSLVIGSGMVIFRHRKDSGYSTTGTSGTVMGCMFAFMLIDPGHIVYYLPGYGGVKAIYVGLLYILMLIVYQRRSQNDLINHEYHFYGGLGGIITTLVLHPEILHGIRG